MANLRMPPNTQRWAQGGSCSGGRAAGVLGRQGWPARRRAGYWMGRHCADTRPPCCVAALGALEAEHCGL